MHKLFAFLLILPLFSSAQDDDRKQLFLNQKNEITAVEAELKCIKNEDLSSGYAICYECIDAAKKTSKQLNVEIHVKAELKTADNRVYIKNQIPEYQEYLIGEYKNGKPYNGFFRLEGTDWLVYNYYKEGKLVQQLYNDRISTIQQEEDNQLAATTLNSINTFTDGVLISGIKIMPVKTKREAGEIITIVKDAKVSGFMFLLYAENFAECVKITPSENGVRFKSLWNNAMKITFTPDGRKVEMFNKDGKLVNTLNYKHYKLSEAAKVDQKRFYVYICKDREIYIEQINDEKQLLAEEQRSKKDQESAFIRNLGSNFYSALQINPALLERIINDKYWGTGTFLGRHDFYEGKAYGIVYHKGDTGGTYHADSLGDEKDTKIQIRNKTPAQIIEILKKQ